MPLPSNRSLRLLAPLAGVLILGQCSGGERKPILTPTVRARLAQDAPPASPPASLPSAKGVVFFDNVITVGDSISMDVVIRNFAGVTDLDIDDVDLVFRYDSTFIQVASLSGQNTLFGTCNTVNLSCGINSPICTNNRQQANAGGSRFCRSDGRTFCTADTDCTAAGDACGSFGILQAAFAVLTGPKVCSNDPNRGCSTSADCSFCESGGASCSGTAECNSVPLDCSGNLCTNIPGRTCTQDADCLNTCVSGTCQGCPSVLVSTTRVIANVTIRVMKEGIGDFRLVVSSSGAPGSAVRKDLADLPVVFFPSVDAESPFATDGAIAVTGNL
ncbi:MAG TPA: hypothetical protein VGR67_00375 [Candidatus Polarisedimenticolia bacterium]|jgi:hypothetical protein|nr:hypothetical protein [Candidatus Polarisedimenticolia bacterium]